MNCFWTFSSQCCTTTSAVNFKIFSISTQQVILIKPSVIDKIFITDFVTDYNHWFCYSSIKNSKIYGWTVWICFQLYPICIYVNCARKKSRSCIGMCVHINVLSSELKNNVSDFNFDFTSDLTLNISIIKIWLKMCLHQIVNCQLCT